jgi:hypothetical protein
MTRGVPNPEDQSDIDVDRFHGPLMDSIYPDGYIF